MLFPADYDDEFDSVFGTGRHRGRARPAPDPTVYVSAPDDPALRPDDDREAWFVLVNAPRHRPGEPGRGVDWHADGLAEAYADRVLEVMAERGLDVRDRVLWRVVRTPADLEHATRSVGGSIYGSSSNGARSAFLRPANASNVEGLFLVGGSAHPGGGIPLVGMSAKIVADLVGAAAGGARRAGRPGRGPAARLSAQAPRLSAGGRGLSRRARRAPGASPRSAHTSSVAVEELSV